MKMIRFACKDGDQVCDPRTLKKLSSMQRSEILTDLMLICGHTVYHIHKLVLSAYSSHFYNLYSATGNGNPPSFEFKKTSTILMNDVKEIDIENLINYLYKGEILIPEQNLSGLMQVAKNMHVDTLKYDMAEEVQDLKAIMDKSVTRKSQGHTKEKNKRQAFAIGFSSPLLKSEDTYSGFPIPKNRGNSGHEGLGQYDVSKKVGKSAMYLDLRGQQAVYGVELRKTESNVLPSRKSSTFNPVMSSTLLPIGNGKDEQQQENKQDAELDNKKARLAKIAKRISKILSKPHNAGTSKEILKHLASMVTEKSRPARSKTLENIEKMIPCQSGTSRSQGQTTNGQSPENLTNQIHEPGTKIYVNLKTKKISDLGMGNSALESYKFAPGFSSTMLSASEAITQEIRAGNGPTKMNSKQTSSKAVVGFPGVLKKSYVVSANNKIRSGDTTNIRKQNVDIDKDTAAGNGKTEKENIKTVLTAGGIKESCRVQTPRHEIQVHGEPIGRRITRGLAKRVEMMTKNPEEFEKLKTFENKLIAQLKNRREKNRKKNL